MLINSICLLSDPNFQPAEVLLHMREFIRYFLGCSHCAENFVRYTPNIAGEISDHRDGVLWLWQAHNKVNNVLHGDATEDPYHPKIQFPASDSCYDCRRDPSDSMYDNDTEWRMNKVLHYMTHFYRKDNIIHDQLPYVFATGTCTNVHSTLPSALTVITVITLYYNL